MADVFTRIKPLSPKFSNFNNSYDHKTTMFFGQLVPIFWTECLPGDVVRYSPQAVVRMQPTLAPILHKIEVRFESFFVPSRLLDENWINFITGGQDGEYLTPPPSVKFKIEGVANSQLFDSNNFIKKGSLWDYFGLPTALMGENAQLFGPKLADVENRFVSDLPFRAYNLVYNQYYRDENIESEDVDLSSYLVQQRYYTKNDYFTSALPFVLRGVTPTLSATLSGVGDVVLGEQAGYWGQAGRVPDIDDYMDVKDQENAQYHTGAVFQIREDSGHSNKPQAFANLRKVGYDSYLSDFDAHPDTFPVGEAVQSTEVGSTYGSNLYFYPYKAKLDNVASTITANELRWLFQAQKFLERQARGGVRYNEFIMNNFSVATGDYRIDRAEFVRSSSAPIIVAEIPQTSAATSGSTPQGNLAGKGVGTSISNVVRYRAREYGFFITMCSIVPKLSYVPQGIGKEWKRDDKYKYFFPQFAHMSEQEILNSELYLDSNTDDSEPFGYSGIYNEYRHRRDIVTNDFRDTLDFWHCARKFSNNPGLNKSFLKISKTELNRIFAVQDEPPFLVDCYNSCSMVRPIPRFAEPGLVDHF